MRIEKFVHSCLRITSDGQRLLFDPGKFSFVDGRVDPRQLADADIVAITHDHPDHLDFDALRVIVGDRPVTLLANGGAAKALRDKGFAPTTFEDGERTFGAFRLQAIPALHAPILAKETPRVTAFCVNERLLHVGDSFDDSLHRFAGIELLAMPVMAPFLTELDVYEFAKAMKPKTLIPLHDGYARDFFIEQRYDTYEPFLKEAGISLQRLAWPGDAVEV
ncbi:MAG: MBL fold metallo-hydrolase [Caulobacterales bacterium 68-7]|jgi:L-ascorbate metabolism protein UlaG (beta-lactamase superfamily)|nr:MAG: MBL fold metallo-hydrolase [Caulobacterales bacterium 68-7]RYE50320.1 MAG: MBL fold metallo-hydrolase [Hyphomicrobiales bacterium]